jgi:CRP-like cAMP-binding protein
MATVEDLKPYKIFKGFSDSGLTTLTKIIRPRSIPAGTPIFVENMVAESMFIIKSGEVDLSIKDSQGKDFKLDSISDNQAFGELSLLIGGQRIVTATAKTDCELYEISRQNFAKLQKQKPQTCLKLIVNIVNQFGRKIINCRDYLKPLITSQIGD